MRVVFLSLDDMALFPFAFQGQRADFHHIITHLDAFAAIYAGFFADDDASLSG